MEVGHVTDKQPYGGKEGFRERVRKPKVSENVLGKRQADLCEP